MGMRGIRVGMQEISVGTRGIGMEMQGIRVGMRGTGGGNEGNQGDNLRIGVEMMDKNMESDKNKKKCAHL